MAKTNKTTCAASENSSIRVLQILCPHELRLMPVLLNHFAGFVKQQLNYVSMQPDKGLRCALNGWPGVQ